MPYCRHCGNSRRFGSSRVPSPAPYANGPLSGLMADYDGSTLTGLTRLGADRAAQREAQRSPETYFDLCYQCGGTDIEW